MSEIDWQARYAALVEALRQQVESLRKRASGDVYDVGWADAADMIADELDEVVLKVHQELDAILAAHPRANQ
jgi:hypothetical protein